MKSAPFEVPLSSEDVATWGCVLMLMNVAQAVLSSNSELVESFARKLLDIDPSVAREGFVRLF